MKIALLAVVLLAPAARAASLEAASASAERDFALSPLSVRAALEAAAPAAGLTLQPPLVPELGPFRSAAPGAVLARLGLRTQLDRNLHVTNYKFGARALDLGVATDAGFKKFYFAFSDRAGTALAPVGNLNDLRGDGVNIRLDASTVYNFRVGIDIFNPVRGSTFRMTPVDGTSGPQNDTKTGALLDAIRARAVLMTLDGSEYWIFYGRDVAAGGGFGSTRSFLFVRMDGLSSKAWPLAESSLRTDAPAVVDLGGEKISVTLASTGELVVRDAN